MLIDIDVPQVQNLGQRIGRTGTDAQSYASSIDGTLRQGAQGNPGFSAVQVLGQVLESIGQRLKALITDTTGTGEDIGRAANNHAATEDRNRHVMDNFESILNGGGGNSGSSVALPSGDDAPTPTPNPLHEALNGGQSTGDASGADGDHADDGAGPVGAVPGGGQDNDELTPHERFIEEAGAAAKEGQTRYGVPASVATAQAILESGWGESGLAQNSHNYFGIKCQDGNLGDYATGCVDYKTGEVFDGKSVTITDGFRSYDSAADSFADHGAFLTENPRYSEAFNYTDDPDQFIREVHKAGYATDPEYSDKIIGLMERYDLYRFDQ